MKKILGAVVLAGFLAVPAQAHLGTSIVIRHQMRGCHTWAVNGGAFKAKQVVHVARGATITFTNNDVMPHKLVKTHGPRIAGRHLNMNRMSAKATVRFTKAGVYRLKTKAGEDYPNMGEMKTIGEDNVLRLVVYVK